MKDVEKLEKVQKFALRLCVKQWDLDYVSLLFICDLPTLAARRKYFNLCTMYKILIFFPSNMFSPRVTPFQPSSNHLYYQPFCRTNSYLYSFVPNTCSVWNSLPLSVRSSDSISSFKSSFERLAGLMALYIISCSQTFMHRIIGERERANLVVHLAAFFYIYIYIYIYLYI